MSEIYRVPLQQPLDFLYDIDVELFLSRNNEGDWFIFMGGVKRWMMVGTQEISIFEQLRSQDGGLVPVTRLEFLLKTGLDYYDSLE